MVIDDRRSVAWQLATFKTTPLVPREIEAALTFDVF
jgi:hypothetical protein